MTIRDDRGRKMRAGRWWARVRQRPAHHELLAQTSARVEHKSSLAILLEEIITPLCAACFFALVAFMVRGQVHWAMTATSAGVALLFVAGLCVRPFVLRRESRAARAHYRSLIASTSLCPACGYPILNLTVEADGCTVCPECGAAWRLDNDV